jgi:hypothetical protein
VRPDEGLPTAQGGQGAIDHALRFTLPHADINPQYIYPASHVISVAPGSTNLPFGGRLRLMSTPQVDALIGQMGPEAQIIATAMQQYGLVLADGGSAMFVTGASGAVDTNNNLAQTWNMSDVQGLRKLTAADFQVVDLMPRVSGLSVGSGAPGSTITVLGQNFSGSAGHLSVLFGGTPSTSVTYVDDSDLSVVVPNGSGTVDVQVQSGVNEIDPNNPKHNVKNPIFGYGISGTSIADQFTFSTQTVGATNSTVSFASPTVGAGRTDQVTLVVKDVNGNVISGLGTNAFRFALSGGTGTGVFGTVTETATKGTYTALFTGLTAGTADTLTVSVGGVNFATTPAVQVTPSGIDGTKSTVCFTKPTDTSGQTDQVTVVLKDANGNAVTGISGLAFQLALSGGTSAGTFGPVTETATQGTYTALFTGTTAGTTSALTNTVAGVTLAGKPTVQVTPGPISASNSTASFARPRVLVGKTDTLTIVVQDANGNAITGLPGSAFQFTLSDGTSVGTFGTVTETRTKGTYVVVFTGTTAGTNDTLTIKVNGVVLTTKPKIRVV